MNEDDMPPTQWDERYGGKGYVYGTEPNAFLVAHAAQLRGPVLSLAEGEGRNGVYLAARGLDVLGIDSSRVGLAKAEALAVQRGVRLRTELVDLAHFQPQPAHYGAVLSIFAHLPSTLRRRLCPLVEDALQPGGVLLLEGYSERQLPRDTGGPKDLDLLLTVDKVRADFPRLRIELLHEIERDVREGSGHTGLASVVQFVGRKLT